MRLLETAAGPPERFLIPADLDGRRSELDVLTGPTDSLSRDERRRRLVAELACFPEPIDRAGARVRVDLELSLADTYAYSAPDVSLAILETIARRPTRVSRDIAPMLSYKLYERYALVGAPRRAVDALQSALVLHAQEVARTRGRDLEAVASVVWCLVGKVRSMELQIKERHTALATLQKLVDRLDAATLDGAPELRGWYERHNGAALMAQIDLVDDGNPSGKEHLAAAAERAYRDAAAFAPGDLHVAYSLACALRERAYALLGAGHNERALPIVAELQTILDRRLLRYAPDSHSAYLRLQAHTFRVRSRLASVRGDRVAARHLLRRGLESLEGSARVAPTPEVFRDRLSFSKELAQPTL
ncbi:MAG: hypothetical protein K8H88_26285 [Sandaracinaceae bacterium]|nr:hypothetical protein [Sandaracinaceae bacterium]